MGRWAGVLLLACALLPFAASRNYPFVHDDHDLRGPGSLVADPRADLLLLLRADPFGSVERPWGHSGFWRPAVLLLMRAEWWLTDGAELPTAWLAHLVSLGLHALCTFAVAWLLMAIAWPVALAVGVAAVFAVHPVHVESVAWMSAYGDTGGAACGLLGASALVAARRRRDEVVSAGLLLLALFFKESSLLLVVLAGALAWGAGQPLRRAVAAPLAALLLYAGLRALAFEGGIDPAAFSGPTEAATRWLTWLSILPDVVRLSVFPGAATPLHPVAPATGISAPGVLPGALVLALLLALSAAAAWRRSPGGLLASLSMFGSMLLLAPWTRVATGFPELSAPLYERHLYVAALAAPAALGLVLRGPAERAPRRTLAAVLLLVIPLGFATHARLEPWRSDEAFARAGLAAAPESATLWNHLGVARLAALRDEGDAAAGREALAAFERALELDPGALLPSLNRFIALASLGREDDAATAAAHLVQRFAREPAVLDNVAHWHLAEGRHEQAAELFAREIETGRPLPGADEALGECLHELQRADRGSGKDASRARPPEAAGAEGGT